MILYLINSICHCRIKIENPDEATTQKPNDHNEDDENEEETEINHDEEEEEEDFSFLGKLNSFHLFLKLF